MKRDTLSFRAIIPARYASSRFPGKPLALLGGEPLVVRVCRRAVEAGVEPVVATDNADIMRCVENAGFEAVMTRYDHKSGTDRVCEAMLSLSGMPDVVINIQGDEPFIHPEQIQTLMSLFNDESTQIATLARPFDPSAGFEALFDSNVVKVAFSNRGEALYFSRSIIPYVRGVDWRQWLSKAQFFLHVGVYAYRSDTLQKITRLPQSTLEIAESLEQLRWLQAGIPIKVGITHRQTIGIDTPDDLAAAEKFLQQRGAFSGVEK